MMNFIHLILELCSSGLSQTHCRRGLCRPLNPAILQDRWPGDPYRQASPFCSWSSSWPGNLPAKTSCRQSRSRSWRWRSRRSARSHPEASRHCDGLRSRIVEIISTQSRFPRAPDAAPHWQQAKEKGADCAAPLLRMPDVDGISSPSHPFRHFEVGCCRLRTLKMPDENGFSSPFPCRRRAWPASPVCPSAIPRPWLRS